MYDLAVDKRTKRMRENKRLVRRETVKKDAPQKGGRRVRIDMNDGERESRTVLMQTDIGCG
jgi:hypothetical protein